MSCIDVIISLCVGFIGIGDIRHTALRLGARVDPLVDAVDCADADADANELAEVLLGLPADPVLGVAAECSV